MLKRGISGPRVSVSSLGGSCSSGQAWSLTEQDWGWDEGWREGEGGLPYLGPRHPWTSATRLQSWSDLRQSPGVGFSSIGDGVKAGERGRGGLPYLGSTLDQGIPGPQGHISGVGGTYCSHQKLVSV